MNAISSLARDFLSQSAVAVVGISSSKHTVANGVYKKLKTGNRSVFAVGLHTKIFDGDPCYSNLASLPAPVEGVFIAAKPESTERIVEECITLGIPRVWMHNMGGTSQPGSSVSAKAVERCRQHNITVIPGACPMMFCENADTGHTCIKWFLQITGRLSQ